MKQATLWGAGAIALAQTAGAVGFQDGLQGGFQETFAAPPTADWHRANYDFDHPMFDTDWRSELVSWRDQLVLSVVPHDGLNRFAGASMRREAPTHYGRYSATMIPAKGNGLITGFFTYTGAGYGTQHDEIDVEFLGRDTTKVQVGWFKDGKHTAKLLDLGFDAAEGAHTYAFTWLPDRLEWSVDGRTVFTAEGASLPHTPQRLFVNLWAADPSIQAWSGLAKPTTVAVARVSCLSFEPWDGDQITETENGC